MCKERVNANAEQFKKIFLSTMFRLVKILFIILLQSIFIVTSINSVKCVQTFHCTSIYFLLLFCCSSFFISVGLSLVCALALTSTISEFHNAIILASMTSIEPVRLSCQTGTRVHGQELLK